MSKTSSTTNSGIGLSGVVFIVFLVLKLAEIGQVANWSWWWVTSPLWIPFLLVIGFFVGVVLVFLIGVILSVVFKSKPREKNFLEKVRENNKSEANFKKSRFQEKLEEMAKLRNKKKDE